MAEAAHLGPDAIRFNDGLFNTDNRYFREVSTGVVSRMVVGPAVSIFLDTGVDLVTWSFKVGALQHDPDGYGYPSNTVTEFSL